MRYFLGVDGGGSKCDAVLIDETGTVLGWGKGGSASTTYHPAQVVARSTEDALAGAVEQVPLTEVWVGSCSRAQVIQEWLSARQITVHYLAVSEADAAFSAALQTCGLVVLAGTGSFVHGRLRTGETCHLGGKGPVLGDEGSGFEIGLRGLRAAFRSSWTQRRRTTLAEAVPPVLRVPDVRAIGRLVYRKHMSLSQIPPLARVVDEQAKAGDRVALQVLNAAAGSLASVAADVISELHLEEEAYHLIGVGGVIQGSPLYWQMLCEQILTLAPRLIPVVPPVKPAVGAALAAMANAGQWPSVQIRNRIEETQRDFAYSQVKVRA